MKTRDWEELRKILMECQSKVVAKGTDSCKACGMDYVKLIVELEDLLPAEQLQDASYNEVVRRGPRFLMKLLKEYAKLAVKDDRKKRR